MTQLLAPFDTPFHSIPFSQITPEDLKSSMLQAIANARKNIETILSESNPPNFQNTLLALEAAPKDLAKISHILFNLNSAETNEQIQQICEEVSPVISEYQSFVSLNEALFEKIKYVYQNQDRSLLSPEENYYLEKRYKASLRSGVNLPKEKKERLKTIDKELSQLGLQFGKNVLDATNAYFLHITDENQLKGIPKNALTAASDEAKSRNLEGWVFTLHYPSLLPVLKFAQSRELRKELSIANGTKNFQSNDHNNTSILQKIIGYRKERAQLLNYDSFSDFVLEDRMAKSSTQVNQFLEDLLQKAKPFAQKEVASLQEMAAKEGIDKMMGYDHSYYAEKRKEQIYDYTEEETQPFFELNKVRDAAFLLAYKLFGYSFEKREDIEGYHTEVQVYNVTENGTHKALLYLDFHPRPGKRPGAWMTSYQDQCIEKGINIRPHISVVCNFTRPTKDTPSLLTFNEVTTLFHEMGHALHGITANTHLQALSGTSVLWDFVELPSQFLENYCYETEFLKEFAQHYQTQETIPEKLIEKIKASSNFMEGYQTLRQISFGKIDMAYHSSHIQIEESLNPESFEQEQIADTQLYPPQENTCFSTSFSHIFAGGYASGYYSYKWAEVLDADAFAYFKENGIFNPEISAKFKHLLAMGGTVDPEILYEEFRGRPATNEALLKRAGLSN